MKKGFRLIIPEPPEGRGGMKTIEAKSALCWVITFMMAPIAVIWWLLLLFPMAVPVASAWNKPKHTYGWRCAVVFSVSLALSTGLNWMLHLDEEGRIGFPLATAQDEFSGWILASLNFVMAVAFALLPLAAASTLETWWRCRRQPGERA